MLFCKVINFFNLNALIYETYSIKGVILKITATKKCLRQVLFIFRVRSMEILSLVSIRKKRHFPLWSSVLKSEEVFDKFY